MASINTGFLNLSEYYLFSEISKKVRKYKEENPNKTVISLGIGDVTLPLPKIAIEAMHGAVDDMSNKNTFKGYSPDRGYDFLVDSILNEYNEIGIELNDNEVFVSDGVKSDIANMSEIFSKDNIVLMPTPVYPVYVDTNIMCGRKILYIEGNEENNFLPMPNDEHVDIIYLCSPNNPTGSVYTKEQLQKWVYYAIYNNAIILYDSAYSAYITDSNIARSIYEVDFAKRCAIEFCSFSKLAGFTGVRCGYTIVPKELNISNISINKLWLRRQTTKFNGVSYITQKGAEAVLTDEGKLETKQMIDYYMDNSKMIVKLLENKNIYHTGGVNAPYIWMKCPDSMKSWEFFDYLLNEVNVVGTPGIGFGKNSDEYFRLTAFSSSENTAEACERLSGIL